MGLHLTNIHNAFFESFKQGSSVRFAFENPSGQRVENERGMQRLEKGRTGEAIQSHTTGLWPAPGSGSRNRSEPSL